MGFSWQQLQKNWSFGLVPLKLLNLVLIGAGLSRSCGFLQCAFVEVVLFTMYFLVFFFSKRKFDCKISWFLDVNLWWLVLILLSIFLLFFFQKKKKLMENLLNFYGHEICGLFFVRCGSTNNFWHCNTFKKFKLS